MAALELFKKIKVPTILKFHSESYCSYLTKARCQILFCTCYTDNYVHEGLPY